VKVRLEKYRTIPRSKLVNLFTPIERLDRLRKKIPGSPHMYIKRDDLTGYLIGGNKLRKLEYVIADVMRKNATAVVTIGSIQSNHARTTAMVARRHGLKCALVLDGEVPQHLSANYYINNLLEVEIHTVKTREDRVSRMDEVANELEKKGEHVYKIPLGCSDEIGSFGFVAAMEEVYAQQKEMDVNFDAIVIGSSSGGTQAGLEVGKRLFDHNKLRILGVSPDDPSESIKDSMINIMNPMFSRLDLDKKIDGSELWVDDRYFGKGYGIPTKNSAEASKIFSQIEGILLDPVYTSKVGAAFIDYCRKGMFNTEDHVLFWHTGGLMTLFV